MFYPDGVWPLLKQWHRRCCKILECGRTGRCSSGNFFRWILWRMLFDGSVNCVFCFSISLPYALWRPFCSKCIMLPFVLYFKTKLWGILYCNPSNEVAGLLDVGRKDFTVHSETAFSDLSKHDCKPPLVYIYFKKTSLPCSHRIWRKQNKSRQKLYT